MKARKMVTFLNLSRFEVFKNRTDKKLVGCRNILRQTCANKKEIENGLVPALLIKRLGGGYMKYLMITLIALSSSSAFASLTDALSAAIKTSDTEKSNTKVALNVAEDHIEKSTFKRGQKTQTLKDESNILSEMNYSAPENNQEEEVEDIDQQVNLKKELSDIK
jgi:hypothetical protein